MPKPRKRPRRHKKTLSKSKRDFKKLIGNLFRSMSENKLIHYQYPIKLREKFFISSMN